MNRIRGPVLGVTLILSSLAVARLAYSEVVASAGFHPFGGFGYGMGYGGYGYGGYGYGGGTVAGNYLNGMSNVIRSEGQYNVLTSVANINNEEARSKYIDNRKKWTENYWQLREEHQAQEAQKFARNKHSTETLTLAAASGLPRELGPDVLDPLTGAITWPETLLAKEYDAQRKEIEQLFELRAKTTHGAGTSEKIRAATKQMSEKLRANIQNIPANEYIAARKLLDSLDYATRPRAG